MARSTSPLSRVLDHGLAKILLVTGWVAALAFSLRWRDPVAGTGRLFGALLLLSATVYPWYLLWVLPWAALRRHTAWLALSALILLSYLPQFAGVPLWPWVYVGIWGPFAVLMVAGGRKMPPPKALTPAPLPTAPSTAPGEGYSWGVPAVLPLLPGRRAGRSGEEGRGDEGLGWGKLRSKSAPMGPRGEGPGEVPA